MKELFKERSKILGIISIIESILSIWFLSYFNYLDRLNYFESIANKTKDLGLVFENMYTSTFWGLIILVIVFISIFSSISFIYKDEKYQLISCTLWFVLLLLAINIKDNIQNNLSTIAIFIPIIAINILGFIKQKNITSK